MTTKIDLLSVVKAIIDNIEEQLAEDSKYHNIIVTSSNGDFVIHLDGARLDTEQFTMGWWIPMSPEQRVELQRQMAQVVEDSKKEKGKSNE